MKLPRDVRRGARVLLAALLGLLVWSAVSQAKAGSSLVLWDTSSPLGDTSRADDRGNWRVVPRDLLNLEADPPKASSDPGYYGREYAFKGDAVVETPSMTAVFWSAKGRVAVYTKDLNAAQNGASSENGRPGRKAVELAPLQIKPGAAKITRLEVVCHAGDEIVLAASFSAQSSPEISCVFEFDRTGIIAIKPAANMKGVRLSGVLEYGVVPGFIGDDLIFSAKEQASAKALCVPSESMLVGLEPGEGSEWVMTWPKGRQQVKLNLSSGQPGARLIESVDFDNDGQGLYLALLSAPGIWHKETLTSAYLEKDVTSKWKRPFPARWKTQLDEAGVKTTFTFREAKGQIWRGVPGSYNYPVWFNGDEACYHMSKKVAPQGESIVYFLEGQDTPLPVTTPVDIMRATLGRPYSESILDFAGRKLRTHHRRGGEGVRRACTCGCTEAIQAVFENGEEVARKDYIASALDDMIYFVHRHVDRIEEYRRFAGDLIQLLQAKGNAAPELKAYVDGLEQIARQIPEQIEVQKENMKSFAHADDLARRTLALTSKKEPNNVKAYMELLKAWRDMGGAQDYVVAQCHMIARKLCQEAGYSCLDQPKAAALAEEIRARCRQCLRNADGYEIWADY